VDKVIENLKARFGEGILGVEEAADGVKVVYASPAVAKELLRYLREGEGFETLTDLTAIDWLGKKSPRFEVVYQLRSYSRKLFIRVKVPTDGEVDSVIDIWPGAAFMERECWEMFGINFRGHKLRHLLLWDGFPGHPLRKDFYWREDDPLPDNR